VGAHFLGRNGQTLAQLRDFSPATWNLLPRERALVFTNNHDTQRGDGFSYRDGAAHDLATLFLLAWPYGRVVVASSYAFDGTSQAGRDRGPASDQAGNTVRAMGCPAEPPPASLPSGAWVCEHRRAPIAAMATFRRVAGDAPVALWWDNGGNQIAFARQGRGFVVINNESAPLTRRFLLGLPAGRYCDVVRSGTAGSCADPIAVDVTGGAMIEVPARTARVYHLEARAVN
ncbi:MAG TPA: alpha amylase C-terminal domain-containing protein, partial [Polyangia bacterium]